MKPVLSKVRSNKVLATVLAGLCLIVARTVSGSFQNSDRVVVKDDVVTRVVVRASATSQSDDRGSLRPGESADLLGSVPNWFQVRLANGVEGFVSKRWTRVVATSVPVGAPSFTVDVVDVGTGLAILVRGRDFTLVYDAGSNDDHATGDDNRMLAFMRTEAPAVSRIDHLILSHPHTDHVSLMPDLLAAYQVRQVYDSGRLNDICGYRLFFAAVRDEPGVAYHAAAQSSGTLAHAFAPKQCGNQLPAETISVNVAARIDNAPIALGQGATMTVLHAAGVSRPSFNENTLVVRLDLGSTRLLLMGDAEAGGRKLPEVAPSPTSIEGQLLACCQEALAADVLIAGHHGSLSSSRRAFLDAVMASIYVISAGPTKYHTKILPDPEIVAELGPRGQLFRTDLDDAACQQNPAKIGPDADGRPGGCDNVRITIGLAKGPFVAYVRPPGSWPPQVQ